VPNFISIRSGVLVLILWGSNFWLFHKKEKSPLTHGLNYRSACDTATYWPKIAHFAHPLSFRALVRGWFPSNLWKSFTVPETRVFQAADGKNFVILACTVFDWSAGVTDRQTDRIAMAKTRWKQWLLSRAKAHYRRNRHWNWQQKLQ